MHSLSFVFALWFDLELSLKGKGKIAFYYVGWPTCLIKHIYRHIQVKCWEFGIGFPYFHA